MSTITLPTHYYQQFDADFTLDVPAEGYGGWKKENLPLSTDHTAVVVMHAWNCGSREDYPGWHRYVEYIDRSYRISREVFPGLLKAVRGSDMKLFHVVGGGDYYKNYPGYKAAVELAGPEPEPVEQVQSDTVLKKLWNFKSKYSGPGEHNSADIGRGLKKLDFSNEAKPLDNEEIAENDHQLFSLCRKYGINHLIYAGFAINWCLLLSPGGMADMQKHGIMCSAFRQAVTAVENRDTARNELCKELALWRVALAFGFVYDVDDFVKVIE